LPKLISKFEIFKKRFNCSLAEASRFEGKRGIWRFQIQSQNLQEHLAVLLIIYEGVIFVVVRISNAQAISEKHNADKFLNRSLVLKGTALQKANEEYSVAIRSLGSSDLNQSDMHVYLEAIIGKSICQYYGGKTDLALTGLKFAKSRTDVLNEEQADYLRNVIDHNQKAILENKPDRIVYLPAEIYSMKGLSLLIKAVGEIEQGHFAEASRLCEASAKENPFKPALYNYWAAAEQQRGKRAKNIYSENACYDKAEHILEQGFFFNLGGAYANPLDVIAFERIKKNPILLRTKNPIEY